MRKIIVLISIMTTLLMTKYVVSGAYYDYRLRKNALLELQNRYIEDNKRAIAELELYRSANYLFSYREKLNMKELVPKKTIIIRGDILPELYRKK